MIVNPTAEGLAAAAAGAAGRRGPPPVHLWNPPFCGDIDMRVARDGTWFYQGTPIGREPLVRLFASILRFEDGRHYLVTPVEKVGITVEDAPFVAVDVRVADPGPDQVATFVTNLGDEAAAGPDNPLYATGDAAAGRITPYIHIRRGLVARIDRKSFYRLIDFGLEQDGWFGLRSAGRFFPLAPASALSA